LFCLVARTENAVLKEKVRELEQRCKVLTAENETLKAEVEIYRQEQQNEGGISTTTTDDLLLLAAARKSQRGMTNNSESVGQDLDHFIKAGDGTYTKSKEVLLDRLHGFSNPSCCSLSYDDTILATGGADQNLVLAQWGAVAGSDPGNTTATATTDSLKDKLVLFPCGAPVIAVDFARNKRSPFCVAGCMDGSVHVIHIETDCGILKAKEISPGYIKHGKYVRTVVWVPDENIFASSSADGYIHIHQIVWNGWDENIHIEKVQTLNLSSPVESMCFHKNMLVCYVRGTPFLSYFNRMEDWKLTKQSLNSGPGYAAAGFDQHVSFCVMDISPWGEYLALATDTSRNIILEFHTGKQIRNLYGHKNDGFSQPKIGWSKNGQYIYGNTQDGSVMVIWDISTATIVDRLDGHENTIRDLYSSPNSDTVITTSFDKKTHIWLTPY